jgi:GNAT superfamily N-acetyltransferase
MAEIKVVNLSEPQIEDAGRALALAFQADPLQSYALPDSRERAECSPAHFAALLRYGHLFGEVFTTSGAPVGAAVCLPPGAWEVTPERAAQAGLDQLPVLMGADAVERFNHVLAFLEPFHRRDVQSKHWYVMVVGVIPARHGQGFGRALLRPVLDRADAEGLPCYLETAQPGNVSFYQKLGFGVIADVVEPRSGLRLWTFRRTKGVDPTVAPRYE